MEDCLFCKIAAGSIPATVVYEDDLCLAFRDINPQAPCHILLIPKKHITSLAAVSEEDQDLLAHLLLLIPQLARQENLSGGFRVVSNAGKDGAQSVPHLHFHLLGGTTLADRMA